MIRTQIYLSKEDKKALKDISCETGENVSELIRRAVEQFVIAQHKKTTVRRAQRKKVLEAGFGIWRDNPIDFEEIRRSADRIFE